MHELEAWVVKTCFQSSWYANVSVPGPHKMSLIVFCSQSSSRYPERPTKLLLTWTIEPFLFMRHSDCLAPLLKLRKASIPFFVWNNISAASDERSESRNGVGEKRRAGG